MRLDTKINEEATERSKLILQLLENRVEGTDPTTNFEYHGEQRLMYAVVEEGISTYQKCIGSTTRKDRRLFREAEEWFNSSDVTFLFSFENICSILGLNADYLRLRLKKYKERMTQKNNPNRYEGKPQATNKESIDIAKYHYSSKFSH